MRYLKAVNAQPLEGLELGKQRLSVDGEVENIWIKKDKEFAYLQNHALAFYPFPSWGVQVPNKSSFDATEMRGSDPQTTTLTLHPEVYDHLSEKGWIDSEGVLLDKYFDNQNKGKE